MSTDDLRTRIAAACREHRLGRSVVPGHDPGYICECAWRSAEPDCTWTDHPEHVADAVIRELDSMGIIHMSRVVGCQTGPVGHEGECR